MCKPSCNKCKKATDITIPCNKDDCNKQYCFDCCISTDTQCNYCLRLRCCDSNIIMIKTGQHEVCGQFVDNHICTECVEWLDRNKKC